MCEMMLEPELLRYLLNGYKATKGPKMGLKPKTA